MKRCAFLLLSTLSIPAFAAPAHVIVGDEIVQHVRDQFFDPARAQEWAARHARYAAGVEDADAFTRLTRSALAELGASHTAYYPRDSVENLHLRSLFGAVLGVEPPVTWVSIGIDVIELAEGHFVRHVFPGGPAAQAGILRGDRLLTVDAEPFHAVLSFADKAGQSAELIVQRARDQAPIVVQVTAQRVAPNAEWLDYQKSSSAVIEHSGQRVAYQHVYACAGVEPLALLKRTLAQEFASADALVIDFRDGLGGCGTEFLDLFNPLAPTLTTIDRTGKPQQWPSAWRKPVVLLVNGNSRSGKELVAAAFKRHRVGNLVGERTAGAVLMGRPFALADGGLLYLAVQDVRIDGERLEGRGVPVDLEVPATVAYAEGTDEQRQRAIELAAQRSAETPEATP